MGFESFGKKIAQLGQDTKSSVQKVGNVISINSRITEETDKLNELLAKVGSAAYDKFADNPPEGLEETFEEIKGVKETLASLQEQREKAKGVVTCPECGKEYPVGENFCSACGAKLPEVEIVIDEETEDAEAGSDAAEKAKGIFNSFAGKADAFVKGFSSGIKDNGEEEEAAEEGEAADESGEETAESDVEEEFFGEEEAAGEDTVSGTDKAAEIGKKAGIAASRLGSEAQKVASKVAERVTEAINNAKEQAPETDEVEEGDDFLEVEVPVAEEPQAEEEPAAEEPAKEEAAENEPTAEA